MSQTDEDIDDLPTDEQEENEEEQEEEEEELSHWSIYDSDTFISSSFQPEHSTLPENILEFYFSFGYNCQKPFNLTVADPDTLIFSSGNLINFFNVPDRRISFRRSALGGGIAHIKANPCPDFGHIAIAENGELPLIILYEWPSLEITAVLRGGSSRLYSHLDFSSDGLLLASQGGEPDYLITIWDWRQRTILLRTKSYVNDVHRIKFSPYVPGALSTCGVAHIKFWRMAETFTGLKLKGEVGRFGKTEFSDIFGCLPMPDEKVVSGCSWGNILVWDAGLIKLEVFRTLRRRCHEAPIVQIWYQEGELVTVGMDGHVKVWWYEKIDQADPPDDDRIVQIEPTYDFYTPGVMLMCVRKRFPDPLDTTYFGQDGNGGIWLMDLNTEDQPRSSEQLYTCHAGKVVDMVACPLAPYIVSLCQGGRLHVYNYVDKRLVFAHLFPVPGTCLLWVPPAVCPSADLIVCGFDDGTLRVCILSVPETFRVVKKIKAHEKAISKISINPSCEILVSGGEDSTVFFFQISAGVLMGVVPIGYIRVPSPVSCFSWHYKNPTELLIGCLHGEILQVVAPTEPQPYTGVSFLLKLVRQNNIFTSYKSQIRRDLRIAEINKKKEAKIERKRKEMDKLKADNPGLEIDEDVFLADSETEEELEPLHIPEVPNRVLWMQSCSNAETLDEDLVWLSMGGFDAGYIYEYKMGERSEVPFFYQMVDDADDVEISSFIYTQDRSYLIFAMGTGELRVNRLKNGSHHDLSDYWTLPMHDPQNGFVPTLCFSHDEKYLFSCGHDGNIFSFTFNPSEDYTPPKQPPAATERPTLPDSIPDEASYGLLSLEQASLKREQDRIESVAARNRDRFREKLKRLERRFYQVLQRNKKLLPTQVVPMTELELDPRVTQYINRQFQDELELVKRKLEFDVKKSELRMMKLKRHFVDNLDYIPVVVTGLCSQNSVKMARQRKLPEEHSDMFQVIEEKMLAQEMKNRPKERAALPAAKALQPSKTKESTLEYFLVNINPEVIEKNVNKKLSRLLQKYRLRKLKWEKREEQWQEFLSKKPVAGTVYPEDEALIEHIKSTIGDYKLKSSPNFKLPRDKRETTLKKYKELLIAQIKQYNIRSEFNQKVYDLRARKAEIRTELENLNKSLGEVQSELAAESRKLAPAVQPNNEAEYPERHYEVNAEFTIPDDQYVEKADENPVAIIKDLEDVDGFERCILPRDTTRSSTQASEVFHFDFETLCQSSANQKLETAWETELQYRRHARKLFEQDQILHAIVTKISEFDTDLEALLHEKYQVDVDAKLMDIFIVTLHNELIILKEFDSLEDNLQDKVNNKLADMMDMTEVLEKTVHEIEELKEEIPKFVEDQKRIGAEFALAVQDNKFNDFLRKVYKKKYKPPKIRKEDDESSSDSSSESSSSEEDDAKSLDSRDFAIVKLDLNVCPKGCDPALYQYTIDERTKRHALEIHVRENQKSIELLRKDLEMQQKKRKIMEKELAGCEADLERFQREKQERLNRVRCTVVLSFEQLQHVGSGSETSQVSDTLVFPKSHLTSLYKRVGELNDETNAQIQRHRRNVRHYVRMDTDCRFMKSTIRSLQEDILTEMKAKFGKVVDLNELEEALIKRKFGKDDLHDLEEVLLKKIVHDVRLSQMDIKGMYIPLLHFWKNEIAQVQTALTYALRHSTAQQELLTGLFREKVELKELLVMQERKKMHMTGINDVSRKYCEEIKNLEETVKEQNQILQQLKIEIRTLKTKGMVLKPREKSEPEVKDDEPQIWDQFDLAESEDEEETIERKPFTTDIVIPITLSQEALNTAEELIEEMMGTLDLKLEQKSRENFIKGVISSLLHGMSMSDLVGELMENLPIEPDEAQRSIIETTAEQLYTVSEPEITQDDVRACLRDIMEDIIDEVLLLKDQPEPVLVRMLNRLVDQLPYDFLKSPNSLEFLISKLLNAQLDLKLDAADMAEQLATDEAKTILKEVLEKVFDTGMDLLYYIDKC